MSSGNEPQGPNNGGSNEIGVNTQEVPTPPLNLRLTNTPDLEQLIATSLALQPREVTILEETPIGVAMALAYTLRGGLPGYIEATVVEEGEGIGRFLYQEMDQVGNMMKNSALIAYMVARTILLEKEPENRFFRNSKLRLQFLGEPVTRDGSSAGCTMVTSFLSLAMQKPVRKNLAMTGAINLTGGILRVGGVREKTIAAKRCQVKMMLFPEANLRDFEMLEDHLKEGLDARFVHNYNQVFGLAFGYDH